MLKNGISDIRDINLDELEPNGFINNNEIENAISNLEELKVVVSKLMTIQDNIHSHLPHRINGNINKYNADILKFAYDIEKRETDSSELIAQRKSNLIKEIIEYYQLSFSNAVGNRNEMLETFAIATSFVEPFKLENDEISKLKTELSDKIIESERLITNLRDDTIVLNLEDIKNQAVTILNEIKRKGSEQTVSDYAVVFGKQAEEHKTLARIWIAVGIFISIFFVCGIIYIAEKGILQTEIFNEAGKFIRYDFTNLVTKVLVIAVVIFLMSFAFKQYSVNRHLQALNTQRQKALNSYKLFTESISKDDTNSHNALMIQVAKAIYEPQSTGFLNEKGQQVNSGIVELTKIIGKNT